MTARSPWAALVLAVVIAGAVFGIDQFAPTPPDPPDPPSAPSRAEPASGSWVCAVGDERDGTSLEAVAARSGTAGDGPATVEVDVLQEGSVAATTLPEVFPQSHGREAFELEGADDAAIWARWSEAPVAVSREWRWSGEGGLPAATVAGPCAQPSSSQWVIPGMSTVGGNEARLRLANPFRTDATIAIYFVTPEGVREPITLQNWTVPARTVREINVNEVLPEIDDLAAVVEVATGRLSVEGYQIARAAIGGVDGGSLLAAAPAPAESWTIPWVADREDASSWLWIVNTGDRTAPVELTLHTPEGGDVPDGLAELTVPPGELRRVDLSGTLPAGVDEAAVTVRSDGAPVVVSAGTRQTAPVEEEPDELELPDPDAPDDPDAVEPDPQDPIDPDDPDDPDQAEDDPGDPDSLVEATDPATATGYVVQLGSPVLDRSWTVSGGARTSDRDERLRLVNPSGVPATVDITVFAGTTFIEPAALQGLPVPAGSASSVDLSAHLGNVDAWTAFVTASDGEVVVGRVGSGGEDALRLIAFVGMPASAALPDGDLLAGSERRGFVHRIGTSFGLGSVDPFDVPVAPVDMPPGTDDIGEPPEPDEPGVPEELDESDELEEPVFEEPDIDPDDPPDPDEGPDPGEGALGGDVLSAG